MIEISGYRDGDRDGIRRVCFETGFVGRPLDGIIDNREFFLDLATHYFLDVDTSGLLVARDGDQIAGYLFIEEDKLKHDRALEKYFPIRVLRELPHFWNFSTRDLRYYLGFFRAWLRREFVFSDFHEYPAVLHINILESHQCRGVGSMLFDKMFEHLRAKSCPGVQLQTTSANEKAICFFARHGFTDLQSNPSRFYNAYGITGVCNVVMGKKLLPPAS